jgi:hypothetical protein
MSTTSPVTSFEAAVSAPFCSCATASGETAKAAMNVVTTAIFTTVGSLFVGLNINQSGLLGASVKPAVKMTNDEGTIK